MITTSVKSMSVARALVTALSGSLSLDNCTFGSPPCGHLIAARSEVKQSTSVNQPLASLITTELITL